MSWLQRQTFRKTESKI